MSSTDIAIILINPYNYFLHSSDLIYAFISSPSFKTRLFTHLYTVIAIARTHKLPVYYGLYQQYKPGNFDGWKYITKKYVVQ